MTIRKANAIETDYILMLSGSVLNESSMGYLPNNIGDSYSMLVPVIQNGGYFLIDEENRILKGWILLTKDRNQLTNKIIGHIHQLYVYPSYRKMGIGKNLMKSAIQIFYEQSVDTIQLNVFTGNPAKALYKSLGFKKISTVMELNLLE
jgi:ribosomal protein S18 acetylase RimI-like enzyme